VRKVLFVLLAIVLSVGIALTGCTGDTGAKPTIKVGDLNWGSGHFQAEALKIIIEEGYGYPVELVPGATIFMLQALQTGEVHIIPEIWLPNQQEAWDKAIASGNVLDMGRQESFANWQSLFVVPTYVIEGDSARGIEPMAPDLKSVFDLDQPQYKDLFKNPENPSKGGIYSCVPGWECEKVNIAQLAAYELDDDYDMLNPGSESGLFAALMGAYEKGEPHITYLWAPTWISGLLDLTLLEEPPYDETVWNANNGCGYPSADIGKAAYKELEEMAPDVMDMLEKWDLDDKTLGDADKYVSDTGGEYIDAAILFLKDNEDAWTKFVPADVAQKVRDAVAGM
jgi:glycine betaine/proline transport system substrate-binding protein